MILVPCYTEVVTFVGDLLGHLRKRPDDQFSQLTEPLCRLTAASSATHCEPRGGCRVSA